MAKEKSTPFTKERHQPAEKVVSTPPPHLSFDVSHGGDFLLSKVYQKPIADFLVCGRLFCYAFSRKGGDFLTIEEYIKSNPKFEMMPFVTIYTAICELINDGFIEQSAFEKGGGADVAVHELKPKRKVCRRLYDPGDWHSDR